MEPGCAIEPQSLSKSRRQGRRSPLQAEPLVWAYPGFDSGGGVFVCPRTTEPALEHAGQRLDPVHPAGSWQLPSVPEELWLPCPGQHGPEEGGSS